VRIVKANLGLALAASPSERSSNTRVFDRARQLKLGQAEIRIVAIIVTGRERVSGRKGSVVEKAVLWETGRFTLRLVTREKGQGRSAFWSPRSENSVSE